MKLNYVLTKATIEDAEFEFRIMSRKEFFLWLSSARTSSTSDIDQEAEVIRKYIVSAKNLIDGDGIELTADLIKERLDNLPAPFITELAKLYMSLIQKAHGIRTEAEEKNATPS